MMAVRSLRGRVLRFNMMTERLFDNAVEMIYEEAIDCGEEKKLFAAQPKTVLIAVNIN